MISGKKGDAPVMILVLGVFAICVLAILSFSVSNAKSKETVSGYMAVEMANSLQEQFDFYENTGHSVAEIESLLGLKKDSQEYYNITLNIEGREMVVKFRR